MPRSTLTKCSSSFDSNTSNQLQALSWKSLSATTEESADESDLSHDPNRAKLPTTQEKVVPTRAKGPYQSHRQAVRAIAQSSSQSKSKSHPRSQKNQNAKTAQSQGPRHHRSPGLRTGRSLREADQRRRATLKARTHPHGTNRVLTRANWRASRTARTPTKESFTDK